MGQTVHALFVTWRRALSSALTSAIRTVSRGASRTVSAARTAWGSRAVAAGSLRATLDGNADTSRGLASTPVRWVIVAIALGCVGAGLTSLAGGRTGPAIAGFLLGAVWVFARLIVMRAVAPERGVSREIVTRAWAAGAMPYALAVIPALRLLAWGVGAALTLRALRQSGVEPRASITMTAWGYGAEAIGVVVVWIARGLLVAALFPPG